MRKVIRTTEAPQPRGVYSQAIVSGDFVFVAGQVPVNPKTNELELGDFQSQARLTLRNLRAVLEASGSSLSEIVRIGVYLADLNDFPALNEVFKEFFVDDPPARTTVGALLPKIKIEIDAIARVRKKPARRG